MKMQGWMGALDGEKILFEFNLPATHNSAARYVRFKRISKCQSLSVMQQLNLGIRVFDLRVKPHGKKLYLVHGIANVYKNPICTKAMDLKSVIDDFSNFLNNNKRETVVLQFKNDSEKEQQLCSEILFDEYIKDCGSLFYIKNKIPSLDEARGKIVLLRRCKANRELGIDVSLWKDQGDKVFKPLLLSAEGGDFVIQDRYNFSAAEKWERCVLPFLNSMRSFNGKYVLNYLSTSGGCSSPYKNSRYINTKFTAYSLDKGKYYGSIYLDFPSAEAIEKIVETNF